MLSLYYLISHAILLPDPMRYGPGRHSGEAFVHGSDRLHAHVELIKTAEDASSG